MNSSSTIRRIKVSAVKVPMSQPHRTASGVIHESPLVLLDIEMSDGVVGHSMIFTYTAAALKPTAELIINMEPLLIGQLLAPRDLHRTLSQRFRLLGTQGLVGMALSAIDMALWDALARTYGVSLVQLSGGVEKQLPAYGATGYDGAKQSAMVAEQWAKQEFKGVKAKIGYPTWQEDLAVIRSIRNAVGPDMAIMVDYNQSLTPRMAINRLQMLAEEDLTWVEEPTLAHDYVGHAIIAEHIKTPIQCGENWWGVPDMRLAIEAKSSDYMMLDVMKIGGVTGWLQAAELAGVNGIMLSNHLWPEISAQLLSLTPTAHWLEYADWWNPILEAPLQIEGGLTVPQCSVGTGIKWNAAAVERYLV